MNLNQLRAFVAVVDRKSFSDAARALGVSQPAVTLQIQSLEHQLSTTLLQRRYKKVEMTESGRLLYPVAVSIIDHWVRLTEGLAALEGSIGGRLVIGASTTPGHYLLPRIVGGFKREHPQTAVLMEVADTQATLERLLAGDLDLAFVGEQPKDRRITSEAFATDDIIVVCPPDHPLANKRKPVPLEALTHEALIFREKGSATRRVVENHLAMHAIAASDLDVVLELGTSEAVVNAVESGLGIGVISRFAAEKSLALGTLAAAKVETLPIRRDLYLAMITKRPLSRTAEAFLSFARANRPPT